MATEHPSHSCRKQSPETGEVDREAVGKLVFSDAAARRKLNAATHLPIALSLAWRILLHWLLLTPVVVRTAGRKRKKGFAP